ncbi:MAG: metalloregulator ArsR/SmtB family transcription factor [Candidatus Omnitrophica bacterium]|nr:metalloregulator ArsR/SmtB family transcription factor [Candidatus Omnitrophota bacterium]
MDYLLQIFKAVANETRVKIIELLMDNEEHKIEEIAERIKIPFATCCRNLKILERVYIVNSKRKGGYVFYSLNKPDTHIYNRRIFELINLREKNIDKKRKNNNYDFAKKCK